MALVIEEINAHDEEKKETDFTFHFLPEARLPGRRRACAEGSSSGLRNGRVFDSRSPGDIQSIEENIFGCSEVALHAFGETSLILVFTLLKRFGSGTDALYALI